MLLPQLLEVEASSRADSESVRGLGPATSSPSCGAEITGAGWGLDAGLGTDM